MPGPYSNIYGPFGVGVNASETRPTQQSSESNTDTWFIPCIGNDPNTGTKVTHQFLNFILANFRRAVRGLGVPQDDVDDDLLLKCFQKAMAPPQNVSAMPFECYLSKVSTNLVLARRNGFRIAFPNGEIVPLPLGGATLAATGLTPATLQYIYAYKSGAVVAIEPSGTAPAVHSTGISTKTGDATRVLVGMAYVDTGPAWADADGKRWVLSYFNRQPRTSLTKLTAQRFNDATSINQVEIHSELRNSFLTWGDSEVSFDLNVRHRCDLGNSGYWALAVDSTNSSATLDRAAFFDGPDFPFDTALIYSRREAGVLAEGLHYATGLQNSNGGQLITEIGTALRVSVMG